MNKMIRKFLVALAIVCSANVVLAQQFLGDHPDANLQPTTLGKTLHTLEVKNDRIFIGYGDYNVNTGPIRMRYFDPASLSYSGQLATGNTEAFSRIRFDGDRVYALHTDPRTGWGPYATGLTDGTGWSDFNDPTMRFIHVYDFHRLGNELFLAGSGGPTVAENAVIYRSVDQGASWQVSLDSSSPLDGYDYSFSRFYGLGSLNGTMYAQQVVAYYNLVNGNYVLQTQGSPELMLYDGNSWTKGSLMRTADNLSSRFYDPEETAGHLVFRNGHGGYNATRMFKFNGTTMTELKFLKDDLTQALAFDHFVDQSGTYVLRNDGKVSFSSDLQNWFTLLSGLSSNYRSLAHHDGYLYFGDNDAGLHRMQFTAIPEPGVACGLGVVGALIGVFHRRCRKSMQVR